MSHRIKRVLLIGAMHMMVYLFFLPKIILPIIHGDIPKLIVRIAITSFMVLITVSIVRRDNLKMGHQLERETD
jgi:hypothetical protein